MTTDERIAGLRKLIRAAAYEFAEAGPATSAAAGEKLDELCAELGMAMFSVGDFIRELNPVERANGLASWLPKEPLEDTWPVNRRPKVFGDGVGCGKTTMMDGKTVKCIGHGQSANGVVHYSEDGAWVD